MPERFRATTGSGSGTDDDSGTSTQQQARQSGATEAQAEAAQRAVRYSGGGSGRTPTSSPTDDRAGSGGGGGGGSGGGGGGGSGGGDDLFTIGSGRDQNRTEQQARESGATEAQAEAAQRAVEYSGGGQDRTAAPPSEPDQTGTSETGDRPGGTGQGGANGGGTGDVQGGDPRPEPRVGGLEETASGRTRELARDLETQALEQSGLDSRGAFDVVRDGNTLRVETTDLGRRRLEEQAASRIERQLEQTRPERTAQRAREAGATGAQAEAVARSVRYSTGPNARLDVGDLSREDVDRELRPTGDRIVSGREDAPIDLSDVPEGQRETVRETIRRERGRAGRQELADTYVLSAEGRAQVQEAQLEKATRLIDEQVPTDVGEGDVTRTEQGGYQLSQQGRSELERFQERRRQGIRAGRERAIDSARRRRQQAASSAQAGGQEGETRRRFAEDDGLNVPEPKPEQVAAAPQPDAPDQFPGKGFAGQETRAPDSAGVDVGVLQEPSIGTGAAREVSPHAAMGLDQAGLAARAEREQIFAERAEQGFEDLTNLRAPNLQEVGAMTFQAAEIGERAIMDVGRTYSEPIRGEGPTLPGGNTVGDVGANLIDFGVGGVAAGVGAVGQFPVTAAADTRIPGVMERDATVSRRTLQQPRIQTPTLAPGEEPSTEAFAQEVASLNPTLTTDEISVSREDDQYQVQTDLTAEEQRERIAAANQGVGARDITFVGEGESAQAITFERDPEGKTPSEVTGTVGQFQQGVESQVRMAGEAPYATAIMLGLPTAEAVPAGVRGYRATRGTSGSVQYSAITSEVGASGGIPDFRTRPSAPTSKAVRELQTRARNQPETIQEAIGAEQVLYHTTPERLGSELTVAEGASELPGLFVAPDANPIGLSRVAGAERASLLDRVKPSRPDLSLTPDRIAAFEGDRIAAMPESARGLGYELRMSSGRVAERGLGRWEAKRKARGTGLEVRPQSNLPGYRFLTEQAEPGTAYAKPRASRSTELEGIFPPESRFRETGRVSVELPTGERVPADIYRRAAEQPSRGAAGRTGRVAEETTARDIGRSYPSRVTGRGGFTSVTYATAARGVSGRRTDSTRQSDPPTYQPTTTGTTTETPTTRRTRERPTERVRETPTETIERRASESEVPTRTYDPTEPVDDYSAIDRSTSERQPERPSRPPSSPTYPSPSSPMPTSPTPTTPTTSVPETPTSTPITRVPGTPFDTPTPRRRRWPDPDGTKDVPEEPEFGATPWNVPFQNPIATGAQVLFGTVGGGFGEPIGGTPETTQAGPVDETGLRQPESEWTPF